MTGQQGLPDLRGLTGHRGLQGHKDRRGIPVVHRDLQDHRGRLALPGKPGHLGRMALTERQDLPGWRDLPVLGALRAGPAL